MNENENEYENDIDNDEHNGVTKSKVIIYKKKKIIYKKKIKKREHIIYMKGDKHHSRTHNTTQQT